MRSTTRFLSLLLALAFALSMLACSDDDTNNDGKKDGAVKKPDQTVVTKKDKGPEPDKGPPPKPLECKSGCTDFVLNKIIMPLTSNDAQTYAMEFKGKKYNALGNILALLNQQMKGMSIQASIDGGVCSGGTVVLLKLLNKDFTNDSAAKGQAWVGKKQDCCPVAAKDKTAKDYSTKCCTEAGKSCFSGTGSFEKDAKSKNDMIFSGSITAGKLMLGPSKLAISIPLVGSTMLDLTLKYAHISGPITKSGIIKGTLSGAIPKSDLDNKVIPQVASMLDDTLQDPTTDKSTKDMIKQLFDTNPADGKITKDEVANNALIKTFLSGDVDVDNDGQNELSLGIGFNAVGAKIGGGTTTPDQGTTTPDKGTTTPDKGTTTPDAGAGE